MQRILSAFRQGFYKSILVLSTISLIVVSSSLIFVTQASLAAQVSNDAGQKLVQQEQRSKASQTANQRQQDSYVANQREQNYEEQIEVEKDPDKEYRENLAAERRANPDEGIVQKTLEKAENIVDKVTGK